MPSRPACRLARRPRSTLADGVEPNADRYSGRVDRKPPTSVSSATSRYTGSRASSTSFSSRCGTKTGGTRRSRSSRSAGAPGSAGAPESAGSAPNSARPYPPGSGNALAAPASARARTADSGTPPARSLLTRTPCRRSAPGSAARLARTSSPVSTGSLAGSRGGHAGQLGVGAGLPHRVQPGDVPGEPLHPEAEPGAGRDPLPHHLQVPAVLGRVLPGLPHPRDDRGVVVLPFAPAAQLAVPLRGDQVEVAQEPGPLAALPVVEAAGALGVVGDEERPA